MFKDLMSNEKKYKCYTEKRDSILDYVSTTINRVLFDKSNFVLRSIDMIENTSYLPIIRDLTEKLNEKDVEIRILATLLQQLKFIMLIIDSRGNIIYSNKKDLKYNGLKCWEMFKDRTGQCTDCYFNPLGGDTENTGASMKRYPAGEKLPEHIIVCHPVRDNGHSFMVQFIVEITDGHMRQKIKEDLVKCIESL